MPEAIISAKGTEAPTVRSERFTKSVSFFANRVPGTAPSYAAVRALQDYAERYVHA